MRLTVSYPFVALLVGNVSSQALRSMKRRELKVCFSESERQRPSVFHGALLHDDVRVVSTPAITKGAW